MRGRFLTALSPAFLVGACAVGQPNQADNWPAETNGSASTVSNGASGEELRPEASASVTLSAEPATTSGGSRVTLTLNNAADEPIGYNLCTSALETSAGRPVPTSKVCTMELRMLEPGRNADYRYELPVNMLEGSYRFVTQVEWMQSGRRGAVRSNSFEVRAD